MVWFLALLTLIAWCAIAAADTRAGRSKRLRDDNDTVYEAPSLLRQSLANRAAVLRAACSDALDADPSDHAADGPGETLRVLALRVLPHWGQCVREWRGRAQVLQAAGNCSSLPLRELRQPMLRRLARLERCAAAFAAGEPGRLMLHLRTLRAALICVERRVGSLDRLAPLQRREALHDAQADIDTLARDLAATYEALRISSQHSRAILDWHHTSGHSTTQVN